MTAVREVFARHAPAVLQTAACAVHGRVVSLPLATSAADEGWMEPCHSWNTRTGALPISGPPVHTAREGQAKLCDCYSTLAWTEEFITRGRTWARPLPLRGGTVAPTHARAHVRVVRFSRDGPAGIYGARACAAEAAVMMSHRRVCGPRGGRCR